MIITDQIVWCLSRSFSWQKGITSGGKLSLETITGDDSYREDNDDGLYESDVHWTLFNMILIIIDIVAELFFQGLFWRDQHTKEKF